MKKFWQDCKVVKIPPSDHFQQKTIYSVAFDGKLLKLLSGKELAVESKALAEGVAIEWQKAVSGDGDKEKFSFVDLPLTEMINTTVLLTPAMKQALIVELASYAKTDLLYYFAETPELLYQQQKQNWLPQIKKFEAKFGNEVKIKIIRGIVYQDQDPKIYAFAWQTLKKCAEFELVALRYLIKGTGSFILGKAVAEQGITAEEAFNLSLLDEFFQERFFGAAPEVLKKREKILHELQQAVFFLNTCYKAGSSLFF